MRAKEQFGYRDLDYVAYIGQRDGSRDSLSDNDVDCDGGDAGAVAVADDNRWHFGLNYFDR